MALKIEMLRGFCAVAQAGNLSDAADQLGRTQSALSMMLKQFEENLGGRLFESERKNRLSPLGEQVLQLGRAQLKSYDATIHAIETLAQAPQGTLRIAAVPSIAALAFAPVVRHMASRHPSAKIELRDADTTQVLDALGQGWVDIGIASAPRALNGVTYARLFSDRFGLVLSETHALAQTDTPLYFEDVLATPFLRNGLCDQIQSPRIRDHLSKVHVTVRNTQSLLSMVREGDWATLLPYATIRLAPKGLVFRPIVDLPDARQAYIFLRQQTPSPEIVQEAHAFIQSMQWPSATQPPR